MNIEKICVILLLLGACSSKLKTGKQEHQFSGTVTLTSSYCGGARPTDEVLQEYNKPKPYAGKVLYFREGNTNNLKNKIVGEVTVNDSGYFSLRLPAGTYAIVQDEHLRPLDIAALTAPSTISADSACLEKWWATPLKVVEVGAGTSPTVELNFHKACFISKDIPCLGYDGPMPP